LRLRQYEPGADTNTVANVTTNTPATPNGRELALAAFSELTNRFPQSPLFGKAQLDAAGVIGGRADCRKLRPPFSSRWSACRFPSIWAPLPEAGGCPVSAKRFHERGQELPGYHREARRVAGSQNESVRARALQTVRAGLAGATWPPQPTACKNCGPGIPTT